MIRASGIVKHYTLPDGRSRPVIEGADFSLHQGQSASIQGPSGCGKSTFLYLLAGLAPCDGGTIQVADLNVSTLSESQSDQFRRQHIGIVFQQFHLIDCLSAHDNILFTARLAGAVDPVHIKHLVNTLGLSELVDKPIQQLSGGEQQRVALARALAHKPNVVLADEPTGNLDEDTSQIVSHMLYSTCRALNTTLIVVTHSAHVAQLADVQWTMQQGRLYRVNRDSQDE
ncbi:ABC transporter ATP-binding protein [Alteromonas oceanisediminis]|uniref:ABC transporter ATP-binding protein n=1 Tax=Alteromonas oceanisediminis TaxID=2836180 RepID=UPI001BDA8726|nr:ABC transporter ATP-binding protein [Alteromonas oceanisediminis]MBT0585705.1 ABC transporter ATP-binding protein [Alteromonas oceanisediminis]